ncbi:ATP-grasp domain-containing protein [Pseudoduganella armeniaca]|uniref:ATP-grasp domain-containing protein n=1 Tax=Pseudoduganella armeniaca TaxID=2072590 RepID=A0A2R4CHA8_9BURK|nr:hypothetical protein [Pseudoduganella armeniaca]AVR98848.1 hypothetical protein C9I28_26945 [Pseudoduganella armeniaca]
MAGGFPNMTILIHTIPTDIHAAAVQAALRQKGASSQTWHTGDFPSHQTVSWTYQPGQPPRMSVRDEFDRFDTTQRFDTVWHRRIRAPQEPAAVVAPADQQFVAREIGRWISTTLPLPGQDAFWVNGLRESEYADNKLVQLDAAVRVGMTIPATVATNAPDEIRAFIRATAPRPVIYKPLRGYTWTLNDKQLISYTKTVTEADLPSDDLLRACPGIFQEYIEKDVELRVTIMGHHCVAVALQAPDKEDWRVSSERDELTATPFDLAPAVREQCLALMKRLGIVFGCIDFVVTPQGEYVFLEINEMGQFLWVEDLVPETLLLDAFTSFLIARDPEFTWRQPERPLRLAEIGNSPDYRHFLKLINQHVPRSIL